MYYTREQVADMQPLVAEFVKTLKDYIAKLPET